jgi:hypothetical protein
VTRSRALEETAGPFEGGTVVAHVEVIVPTIQLR